ncbi:MAG: DNA helicase RecG, partial [Dehalococcoidia bacterium]|nr:DNA helicase RecG [Dehalococcoidia bacterium]
MAQTIDTLRRILEVETARGCDDRAVIGGLGAFLQRWKGGAGQVFGDRELLLELQRLAGTGCNYSHWDREQRKRWISELTRFLDRTAIPCAAPRVEKPAEVRAKPVQCHEPARREPSQSAARLDAPISTLHGVGPAFAAKLQKLGAATVRDILYLFPRRHIDYSKTKRIRDLTVGEEQTIVANVWQAGVTQFGRVRGTEAVVGDETGNIRVIWFNQPWLAQKLAVNARVAISGRVNVFRGERLFESPEWDLIEERD